ncbi:M23 family metallopeptidase [Candidatus Ichthyocystis hellenicum]|uniref:M23 family metallopeptidase n=1 Tax=Candidatus Ichthyocystis hellenicum TaxID=1561003 RepID=UPI000B83A321|nr:M23 family metallopeptidase [Candidatus Ichthyocystis hellenicum]
MKKIVMFRSLITVIVAALLLLSGCAPTTVYQSELTISTTQRQRFIPTVAYCQNCYVTFSDISDLKTFSKHLNCPDSEMISANPYYSLSTVIHNGEVIHLPDSCKSRQQSSGLTISPITAAITSETLEQYFPLILRNNYCNIWISPNRYSKNLIALICPTSYKPLSLRKWEHGGVVFDVDNKDKVLAAAAGQVVLSSSSLKKYGNLIVIRHGYDYASVYSHLGSTIVKNGDSVQVGQPIATPLCVDGACSFDFNVRFSGHILPLHLALRGVPKDVAESNKANKSRKDKESPSIVKKRMHVAHDSNSSLRRNNYNSSSKKTLKPRLRVQHGKKRAKTSTAKSNKKSTVRNRFKHEKTHVNRKIHMNRKK